MVICFHINDNLSNWKKYFLFLDRFLTAPKRIYRNEMWIYAFIGFWGNTQQHSFYIEHNVLIELNDFTQHTKK